MALPVESGWCSGHFNHLLNRARGPVFLFTYSKYSEAKNKSPGTETLKASFQPATNRH